MSNLSTSTLNRLRWTGYVEGTSFLLLLLVAMPLKYLADMPGMVTVVGTAHGFLWIAYIAALAHAGFVHRWPLTVWAAGFMASVLPGGPWFFDGWLARHPARLGRS